HLPFDPPLGAAGATLGGVVAAGTSGPGAFGHGGVRDFVIGVRFVDGRGRLVAGGGKVVKNAAGFDLPKLLVGSIGRLGAIAELFDGADDAELWERAAALAWLPDGARLVRVALAPRQVPQLDAQLAAAGARARYSLGANLAWVAWPVERPLDDLDAALRALGC